MLKDAPYDTRNDPLNISDPHRREPSGVPPDREDADADRDVVHCKYDFRQPFMYPKNSLGYVENFLYMMFGTPCADYKPKPVLTRAIETILILHVDHEQNASTSIVRTAGSSGVQPFACVACAEAAVPHD